MERRSREENKMTLSQKQAILLLVMLFLAMISTGIQGTAGELMIIAIGIFMILAMSYSILAYWLKKNRNGG